MNNRILLLLGVVVVVVVVVIILALLGVFGGGGLSEADAAKAIEAGFKGDIDEANKYFCDADKVTEQQMAATEGVEVKEVSCKKDGDKMNCDVTTSVAGQEMTFQATFDIEDDKLCNGNIGTPEIEIPEVTPTEPAAEATEAAD